MEATRTANPVGRRIRLRSSAALVMAGTLAVLLAACSSTTAPSGTASSGAAIAPVNTDSVNQKALAATIKQAWLADRPVSELDPVLKNTMAVASTPLTADQNKLLATCLQHNTCDTGHGSLTVAFTNDVVNPFRSVMRAEFTAQAIAMPQIKTIVYNSGPDVAAAIANIKSLTAQRVDIIVMSSIYGGAVLNAVRDARNQGIIVIQTDNPLPKGSQGQVDSTVASNLCRLWPEAAKKIAAAVPEKSTYAIYTGVPGNSNAANWQPCFEQAMQAAGWTRGVEGFTQWTPQGTAQAANALLASGKKPAALAYDYTPEDFIKPYIKDHETPPVVWGDTVNYAWLKTFKDAQDAGLKPKAFVADSQVWVLRAGLTAGVMKKAGQQINNTIDSSGPVVDFSTLVDSYDPSIPADSPIRSLLTPDEIKLALTVS
jgi:ABC-type sugar transport system substrate-binding protein